jgi:hypothetical protein
VYVSFLFFSFGPEVIFLPKLVWNLWCYVTHRSRDSSVGIATCYGLECPGIESRWGEIFRTYPDRLWGPPSLLYKGYWVFPGGKGGRGVMLTTHPRLVLRLRKSWAIPPLTLWVLLGLLWVPFTFYVTHNLVPHIFYTQPESLNRKSWNYGDRSSKIVNFPECSPGVNENTVYIIILETYVLSTNLMHNFLFIQ